MGQFNKHSHLSSYHEGGNSPWKPKLFIWALTGRQPQVVICGTAVFGTCGTKKVKYLKKKNIDLLYFTSVKHSNERKDD